MRNLKGIALPVRLRTRAPGNRQLTRARERSTLAPHDGHPPHTRAMAGSPLKRQRKLGIRADDGSIIIFPRMPRVVDLPSGWRHFSAAQKIEHLIGLDRCYEILSLPWAELDPLRRSMRMQVMWVLLPIGIKAAFDGSLDRE